MSIFLDTSKIELVKKYLDLGVIKGVTTNPTILKKNGTANNLIELEKFSKELSELINPLPLSIELFTNDFKEMITQALEFSKWAKNINIKVTIHGPKYEDFNLEVINILENKEDIRVNVTAIMSAQQALLALYAGASYVSIFGGRINNIGHSSNDEIKKTRLLIDKFNFKGKIIVGSVREVSNITDWLLSGADIITVAPEVLKVMLNHPYTKETVMQFLDDSKNIF